MTIISEYLSLQRNESSEFKRLYTLSLLNISLDNKLKSLHLPYREHSLIEKVEMISSMSKTNNYLRDLCLDLVKCLEIIENKRVFVEGSEFSKIKAKKLDIKIYPSYVFDMFGNVIEIKTSSSISVVDEIISLIDLLDKKLPLVKRETSARVLKL